MISVFRPTASDDLDALRVFLAGAFNDRLEAPFLDPRVMTWKYWELRDDWDGPRGYVLERGGRIVAHAGVWPMNIGEGNGSVRGAQMIDWASDKSTPGAGVLLVQKLMSRFDFIYSIGGSEITQKVLPTIGFVEFAKEWRGVCPLRPLAHIRTHQERSWKLAPRLLRSWWLSRPRGGDLSSGWEAIPIAPVEIAPEFYRGGESVPHISPRLPSFFDYLLRCPAAPFRLFRLVQGDKSRGHFMISVIRGQARLAGIWLNSPSYESWASAYALARRISLRLPDANEIIAVGSDDASRKGALAAGFRVTSGPIIYLKGQQILSRGFRFQLSDYDAAFLDGGSASYWS